MLTEQGKDPAYVAEDADLHFAVENIVDGALQRRPVMLRRGTGYIHRALYLDFLDRAKSLAAVLARDPLDEKTWGCSPARPSFLGPGERGGTPRRPASPRRKRLTGGTFPADAAGRCSERRQGDARGKLRSARSGGFRGR